VSGEVQYQRELSVMKKRVKAGGIRSTKNHAGENRTA